MTASVSDRVTAILKLVGDRQEGVTLPLLIQETGISKPTLHRLVGQLKDAQFVEENEEGCIVPGVRLVRIALKGMQSNLKGVQQEAILTGLSKALGETCGISVPGDGGMVYYDRVQTNWPLQVRIPLGFTSPYWATASGKLYLSSLSRSARQTLLAGLPFTQYAKNTLTETDLLEEEIKRIKQRGFSVDNEEFIDGMVAIAVPIQGRSGQFIASLFCHCPVVRKDLSALIDMLPVLQHYAAALEQMLATLRAE